ncbi:putative membrane protein [Acinetobacter baumannii]|uniref:hypothetical protein n=1 Tax=Acinetobacter baumannii TaxID=470 RepID=UPI00066DCAFC|nr:hypothetical protein [Acinetobacter baumannii]KMV08129.1 putative membrane protein [Acinetobacter baumannii]TPU49322.1 hypothetical protein FJU84_03210 [Acinetobacter baumannii]
MFSLERQKKEVIWKDLEFYKEHWSIIIFIPAFLGGFFQISRLYLLDPSFIRFFSVQQVIPDGLFILFIITLSFLLFTIFNRLFTSEENINIGWNIKNIHKNIKNKLYPSLALLFLSSYIHVIELLFNQNIPLFLTILQIIFEIITTIYLGEVIFIILSLYIYKNIKPNSIPTKDDKNKLFESFFSSRTWNILSYLLLLPIVLLLILYFSTTFSKIYTQVNKLPKTTNEKIFLSKVHESLKLDGKLTIEYYNGTYIFIKIKKNTDQYLILKGESFINLIDKDEK